jgi:hypothetical protein
VSELKIGWPSGRASSSPAPGTTQVSCTLALVSAARKIYDAAGWWNEHFGRVKTLAYVVLGLGAAVVLIGGLLIRHFGLLGTAAIVIGSLVLIIGVLGFVVDSRYENTKAGSPPNQTEITADRLRAASLPLGTELRDIRHQIELVKSTRPHAHYSAGFQLPAARWDEFYSLLSAKSCRARIHGRASRQLSPGYAQAARQTRYDPRSD